MRRIAGLLLAYTLWGCGGGAGGDGGPTVAASAGGCSGTCAVSSPVALTVAEVERILSQAVQEAQARGVLATIAVVDRVGNVLGVFRMTGAAATFTVNGGRGITGGLEAVNTVGTEYAAISKAMTGAYLSSEGNAFSTRTASQIVQQNFNPGVTNATGGPLFGVQFSSLSCSDIVRPANVAVGPRSSPLGLSADPGGLPLYKSGQVVGGIGVISDSVYGLDLDIQNVDTDNDELIAVAGGTNFAAPDNRRANRITVGGNSLRYVDSEAISSTPSAAPATPGSGALIAVTGYKAAAAVTAGALYTTQASGIRADTTTAAFSGLNAYVLDDGAGTNRYPPTASAAITAAEVTRILAEALKIANRTRAQIRQPLGSAAQVSISVVGTDGTVLGLVRTPDAPVFGADVAVQKARSAVLFSSTGAAAALNGVAVANYPATGGTSAITAYVTALQALIGGALTDGIAYSNRAIGALARPFYPDGINANTNGPLSKSFATWSPFTDGLQLDLVINKLVANIGANPPTAPCNAALTTAANGIQIFPGSVPIFRGAVLVGAIGVSGDGIDQDDMISFLGLANAGTILGTNIANAPSGVRSSTKTASGTALPYVNCPVSPFLDTTDTNVCNGI